MNIGIALEIQNQDDKTRHFRFAESFQRAAKIDAGVTQFDLVLGGQFLMEMAHVTEQKVMTTNGLTPESGIRRAVRCLRKGGIGAG